MTWGRLDAMTSHKLMEQDITMVSQRVQIQAVVFEVSPVHVRSLQQ